MLVLRGERQRSEQRDALSDSLSFKYEQLLLLSVVQTSAGEQERVFKIEQKY